MAGVETYLSIVATTLSVASFGGAAWRIWRDRPRLLFYVTPITFTGVPHFGEMKMVQIMICNVGYRPVILTRFFAVGENSSYQMGIDDEPSATIGKQDQKFPTLLEPGKTLKIHPIGIEALRRNLAPPEGPQDHHDPFKFFAVMDSFGRLYPMNVSEVSWHLHMVDSYKRLRGYQKHRRKFQDFLLLRAAYKRLKNDLI